MSTYTWYSSSYKTAICVDKMGSPYKKHLVIFCTIIILYVHHVTSECLPTDTVCEYTMELQNQLTMMKGREAVYAKDGELYMWDDTTASNPVDSSDVITTNGWEDQRLVVAINGKMPGPPIEVWEGQTVVVNVTNRLPTAAATIHWHGLHQVGTPWMDGVPFVTQCPIEPLQTFTYRFKAYPSGTFWYHSHFGTQLSMGAVGAFIIRRRNIDVPSLEHVMLIQEWNQYDDADLILAKMEYGSYQDRKKVEPARGIDGTHYSMFPIQSGLINGKGRYYDPVNGNNGAPLSKFHVRQNETYRFRMIGAGSLYPFKVSVDGHRLTVVASDSFDIEPVTVDYIIINPGERYDFLVHANQSVGRYWVRAETTEVDYHVAEAILTYEGASSVYGATSLPRNCTPDDRCEVLNCPFAEFPQDYYSDCINLDVLRTRDAHQVPGTTSDGQPTDEPITDIFLNFAFPGTTWTPGSVNGRAFRHTASPFLTQPSEISKSCDPNLCGEDKVCACPYSVTLEHNGIYQMVLSNLGSGRGWDHPIHLHGHTFDVVKVGFAQYNNVTGLVGASNPDIDCRGNTTDFCNDAKWADPSWGGNSIPGINLDAPLRKDTVMVPSGGYVVIRIRADNPGAWIMHCHIELHNVDGMALVVIEAPELHPPPPVGFQTCGNFLYDKSEYAWPSKTASSDVDYDDSGRIKKKYFWAVIGCLLFVICLQFVVVVFVYLRSKPNKSADASQGRTCCQEAGLLSGRMISDVHTDQVFDKNDFCI